MVSGDAGGSPDVLAWRLDADAAAHGWDVVLQGGLGTGESLDLLSRDGRQLTGTGIDVAGEAHLYDLHLAAGTYLLRVLGGAGTGPQPYVIRTFVSDVAGADPEPNDDPFDATPISPGVLQRGRLARANDVDQYLLTRRRDAVGSPAGRPAHLACGTGSTGLPLRDGRGGGGGAAEMLPDRRGGPRSRDGGATGGSALGGLLLPPGRYLIAVSGEASPPFGYALRVDATSAPAPDFETEPDDTPATAVPMAPTTVMHGVAASGDPDVFQVVTTGAAQAWTVQAAGSQLDGLTWLDTGGTPIAFGEVSADRTVAVLADAFLPAGVHLFRVTSDGGVLHAVAHAAGATGPRRRARAEQRQHPRPAHPARPASSPAGCPDGAMSTSTASR